MVTSGSADRHGGCTQSTPETSRSSRTRPHAAADPRSHRRTAEAHLSGVPGPHRPPWHPGEVRVLVVEDEASIADALAIGLRAEGFDVDIADNGTDGLWRARETSYAA